MISRPSLRTLFHFPSQRAAIASGAWGAIVDGTGWHEVEYCDGRPFRWAEGGARIELASSPNTWLALDMDVEPGPSLGKQPLHLEFCDQTGKCVARVDGFGRQVAHLGLPVSSLCSTVYTLHVRGDSHPVLPEIPGGFPSGFSRYANPRRYFPQCYDLRAIGTPTRRTKGGFFVGPTTVPRSRSKRRAAFQF